MDNTIIFDCERMKYPNTGLYFFCDMLAEGLSEESLKHEEKLAFYVPKGLKNRWGAKYAYFHQKDFKKSINFSFLVIPISKSGIQPTSFHPIFPITKS